MTTQAEKCLEAHGYTNPLKLVIACKCDGCDGELQSDGINSAKTLAFLMCSVCGCTYTIAAHKKAGHVHP